MKTLPFGKSNDQVSQLALGCLPFGSKLTIEQSFLILDYYADQGGNFLDTSNNYSFWDANGQGGESESVLGEWFRERGNREKFFLATKVGAFPNDIEAFKNYKGNGDPWTELTEGLSRQAILSAVDKSLLRLGTDYIDLYYAHVDARQNNLEETMEAFDELIRIGKVRHIGCSNYKVWRLAQAQEISKYKGYSPYEAVQLFHTYFQTEKFADTQMADPMSAELFDYVRANGNLTLLAYTPLLWGSYTRKDKINEIPKLKAYDRPQNRIRQARLEKIAAETGATINQVIYAWMMHSDPVIIPLVAVSELSHLSENLDSVNITLTSDQMAYLNSSLN